MNDLDVYITLYRSTAAGHAAMKQRLFELADLLKICRKVKPTKKVGLAEARMAATKRIRKEWEKRGMFWTFVEVVEGHHRTDVYYMGHVGNSASRMFFMLTHEEYGDLMTAELTGDDFKVRQCINKILKGAK